MVLDRIGVKIMYNNEPLVFKLCCFFNIFFIYPCRHMIQSLKRLCVWKTNYVQIDPSYLDERRLLSSKLLICNLIGNEVLAAHHILLGIDHVNSNVLDIDLINYLFLIISYFSLNKKCASRYSILFWFIFLFHKLFCNNEYCSGHFSLSR